MADVYLTASALEEASIGGERKILVARQFCRKMWMSGEVDVERLPINHFSVFMNPATEPTKPHVQTD
jgi:hypothetical protein